MILLLFSYMGAIECSRAWETGKMPKCTKLTNKLQNGTNITKHRVLRERRSGYHVAKQLNQLRWSGSLCKF
uniref:Putative secreted protein n=1 Tax=Anopheles darlingi TaxID=43151 RepID=A0A2M4DI02_ANODA